MTTHFNFLGEPSQHADEVTRLVRLGVIEDQRVADCLDRVPLPPTAYVFTFQQRQQQRFFFKEWLSRIDHPGPDTSLDLYTFEIIAVRTYLTSIHSSVSLVMSSIVPDNASRLLRYVLETLFAIHGETQLNMIRPLEVARDCLYERTFDLDWCRDLVVPTSASLETNNSHGADMLSVL